MDDATTRELIRTAAAQIPARPPEAEQLIARAGRTRRPSRWVVGAVAAVVVLLAATALAGAMVTQHRSTRSDQEPTTRRTTPQRAGPVSVASWLRSLPTGNPPTFPYIKGRDFFSGSDRVPVPGYPYMILGGAPRGFLVKGYRAGYQWRYGIDHGDRNVTWLTAFAFDPLETMSKDHQRLAVASHTTIQIVDLVQERVTATIHPDSGVVGLRSLTDEGLVFDTDKTDGTGEADLWSPGHPVRVLPFAPFATSTDLKYALVVEPGKPCADAVRVLPDETTAVAYRGCGNARPRSLAPDGLHAITPDLRTVDLQTGSVHAMSGTGADPGLARVSFQDNQIVWENDTNALIRLTIRADANGRDRGALIRCSTAGDCERIFTDVRRDPWSDIDIQVLDATTGPYG